MSKPRQHTPKQCRWINIATGKICVFKFRVNCPFNILNLFANICFVATNPADRTALAIILSRVSVHLTNLRPTLTPLVWSTLTPEETTGFDELVADSVCSLDLDRKFGHDTDESCGSQTKLESQGLQNQNNELKGTKMLRRGGAEEN